MDTNVNKDPNTVFLDPFKFNMDKVDSLDNFATCYRYLRTREVGGQGLSEWMHAFAVKHNFDAEGFKVAIQDLCIQFNTNALTEYGLIVKEDVFKLTGNNAFANNFKRIHGAMELGADLTNAEEAGTVSKCAKYTKEKAAELRKTEAAAIRRKQLTSLAIAAGLKEGTPEFDQYIDNGMAQSRPQAVPTTSKTPGEDNSAEVKDYWAQKGEELSNIFRDLEQYDPEHCTELKNELRSIMDRARNFKMAALEAITKKLGSKAA